MVCGEGWDIFWVTGLLRQCVNTRTCAHLRALSK